MENAPHIAESGKETKSESSADKKKTRKRGEALVAHTVERAAPERATRPAQPERSTRDWLNLSEREPKSETPPPPPEALHKPQPEVSAETGDLSHVSSETLAQAEKLVDEHPDQVEEIARRRVVEDAREHRNANPEDSGDQAVEVMDDAVLAGEDFDHAFIEGATSIGYSVEEAEAILAQAKAEADPGLAEAVEGEPVATEGDEEAGPADDTEELGEQEIVIDLSETEPGVDAEAEDDEAEADDTVAGGATPTVPPTPPHAGGAGGGGTGGTPPTAHGFGGAGGGFPPFGGGGGFGANGPGGPAGPGGGLPPHPNFAPATPTMPGERPWYETADHGNPAAAALVGGIIGYFIGRRRGRIRTERKLMPIQKKLEKRVEDLTWELRRNETSLRRLASERTPRPAAERPGPATTSPRIERTAAPAAERQTLTAEERRRAPEAGRLHETRKAPPERIGHMLIAAEAETPLRRTEVSRSAETNPTKRAENMVREQRQETAAQVSTERRVETMNRTELLEMSEKIIVDGTSLRQIYETHLVGEHGLRRLVIEHLRGGDIKRALRQEIVEHEIDFERDPAMRDIGTATSGGGAHNNSNLEAMVERAASQVAGANEEAAYYKARSDFHAKEQQADRKQQHLVDIGLVTVISILLAVVVVMYLQRQ